MDNYGDKGSYHVRALDEYEDLARANRIKSIMVSFFHIKERQ